VRQFYSENARITCSKAFCKALNSIDDEIGPLAREISSGKCVEQFALKVDEICKTVSWSLTDC
jgi:hypothetical protein